MEEPGVQGSGKQALGKEAAPPRRFRRGRLVVWTALATILLLFLYLLYQAASIHRFGFRDNDREADCAIVLGAAAWHNRPSPVFKERINHAIHLYEEGRVATLILTGGFGTGAPFAESEVARTYCLDRGVPEEALILETKSRTTRENLSEAKLLLDRHGLRSALVVSDPWHLKRAVAMAQREGIDAHPSATRTTRFTSLRARTNFLLRELYFYHHFLFTGS